MVEEIQGEKYLTLTDITDDLNIPRYVVMNWINRDLIEYVRSPHGGKRKPYLVKEDVYKKFLETNEHAKLIVEQNNAATNAGDKLLTIDQIEKMYTHLIRRRKDNKRFLDVLEKDYGLEPVSNDDMYNVKRYSEKSVTQAVNYYKEDLEKIEKQKKEEQIQMHNEQETVFRGFHTDYETSDNDKVDEETVNKLNLSDIDKLHLRVDSLRHQLTAMKLENRRLRKLIKKFADLL